MRGFFLSPPHLSDEWRLSSNADANGNAQPSSLAAKGYRSVHPNLPSDKPQVGMCPRGGAGLGRVSGTCACVYTSDFLFARLRNGLGSESHFWPALEKLCENQSE